MADWVVNEVDFLYIPETLADEICGALVNAIDPSLETLNPEHTVLLKHLD